MGTFAPAPSERLQMRAKAFGNKGFALVDGGHFANLPSTFKRTRLFARSLFLDRADREVQAAGPWLVSLGQAPDALPRLLDLTEDKPATVFWRCQSGEPSSSAICES